LHFLDNQPAGASRLAPQPASSAGHGRHVRLARRAAARLAGVGMSKMATTPRLPVSRSPALRPCAKELNFASRGLRECPLRVKNPQPITDDMGIEIHRQDHRQGEGIVSKRRDSRYSSARSPHWIKSKNPACAAMR
jgi:hypothetical protein